jgi:hypothetical protein
MRAARRGHRIVHNSNKQQSQPSPPATPPQNAYRQTDAAAAEVADAVAGLVRHRLGGNNSVAECLHKFTTGFDVRDQHCTASQPHLSVNPVNQQITKYCPLVMPVLSMTMSRAMLCI